MPQTNGYTGTEALAGVPRQRSTSRLPSSRRARERDWTRLVQTYPLLSRLAVERHHHHLMDAADTLTRQGGLIEEQLRRCFPVRWPRLHPRLQREEGMWRIEVHDPDMLNCRACWLQSGVGFDRIDVPPPHRVWE